jgi:hypothetical protein
MQFFRVKYIKCLRTRKYGLEHTRERNLCLLILFLELSHAIGIVMIEQSLHTHSEQWQHFQSVFLSLAVGQIQHLPRHSVGFGEKKNIPCVKKTIFVPNDDYFVSVGLQ